MESTDSSSSMASPDQLPPGFRFHPTDEELLIHYLKRKAASVPLPVPIIADIDLYKFDPWELPDMASFGEDEWYFFSQRDRKYPNGARPNRAATSGYWKATGTDKPVMTQGGRHKLGVKKALVFYGGKPPKGIKTNWIMHEYRLLAAQSQYHNNNNNNNMRTITSTDSSNPSPPTTATTYRPPNPRYNCFHPSNSNSKPSLSLRLDDWVLCRIYHKNNSPPQKYHIHASLDVRLTTLPIPPGLALPSPSASTPALHHCTLFQGLAAAAQFPSSSSPLGHTALTELALPMKTTFPFLYYCSDGTAAAGRFHEDYYNNEQQTSTEDESSNAGISTDLLMDPHDQRQSPIGDSTSTVLRPRHDPAFQLPGFNNCYT